MPHGDFHADFHDDAVRDRALYAQDKGRSEGRQALVIGLDNLLAKQTGKSRKGGPHARGEVR